MIAAIVILSAVVAALGVIAWQLRQACQGHTVRIRWLEAEIRRTEQIAKEARDIDHAAAADIQAIRRKLRASPKTGAEAQAIIDEARSQWEDD